ncbi:hypothetical protein M758_10G093200 [Ceratodon purpureus]|uniref:Secreted protein n=1 Tax=Ceratodon purpureus TaxID=3225 RepID=A0A8T0GL65_CERPU|nr:hypothetical protein KC19_10G094600 [Ceratodon purpureus]KAG0603424.1 hypothetical protein M758_10G093200 [Ceratodon purpureus]
MDAAVMLAVHMLTFCCTSRFALSANANSNLSLRPALCGYVFSLVRGRFFSWGSS